MNEPVPVVPVDMSPFDAEMLSDAANGLCLMSNAMKHNIEMKGSVSLQVADLENKLKEPLALVRSSHFRKSPYVDPYKDEFEQGLVLQMLTFFKLVVSLKFEIF